MGAASWGDVSDSSYKPSENITLLLKTFRNILKNELQLKALSSEEKGKLIKLIRKELKDAKPE